MKGRIKRRGGGGGGLQVEAEGERVIAVTRRPPLRREGRRRGGFDVDGFACVSPPIIHGIGFKPEPTCHRRDLQAPLARH